MDILEGVFETYIYHNDTNGYSVIRLESGVIAVGVLPPLNEGEELEFSGEWSSHPKYGEQFKFSEFKILYPKTNSGIINYLASGLIKGIGEMMARRIVNKFGERTLDIFNEDSNRLLEVNGIGKNKLSQIKESWDKHRGIMDLMIYLQDFGISTSKAIKIFKTYGNGAIDIIKDNPYRLAHDIWGVGFKTVDQIGIKLGFDENSPERIHAGVEFILSEAGTQGHVYLPFDLLASRLRDELKIDIIYASDTFSFLEQSKKIIRVNDAVYLTQFYFAERSIEKKLDALANVAPKTEPRAAQFRLDENFYSEEQLEAIRLTLETNLMILTGGPGTGKTTTLNGIISLHKFLEKKIMLAAPTGRAAKRMTEVTGINASTIHRLLEYNPADMKFLRDESNPLEADIIVIDEVSMIDTLLMYGLLNAVSSKTTLILVGDFNQLPSIGPGNILNDLIKSDRIPAVKLMKIFRQAEESKITLNAHTINSGDMPDLSIKKESDFFFIEESRSENICDIIFELVNERLPAKYNFDPLKDIQVISPMYKGSAGVNAINDTLQERYNKQEVLLTLGNKSYKTGDKVMQLKNNYDKDIYNGDIGFVTAYNKKDQKMFLEFSDRTVVYDLGELDEITLAYAVTVHKSQGSEYPCVILPMVNEHYVMHQRNLLYTALTRASNLMILIGSKSSVWNAVQNNRTQNRYTSLFTGR